MKLTYRPDESDMEQSIINLIVSIIGENRPIDTIFGNGKLYSVNLPDATEAEAQMVDAALREQFVFETT